MKQFMCSCYEYKELKIVLQGGLWKVRNKSLLSGT